MAIKVTVAEAAPEGALEPRYDEESQILAAESPVPAEWPFGVDIDGRVVFDLGSDRTLMNFDLHIGREYWDDDPSLRWPAGAQRGRLIFDEEAVKVKSFHLALRITTTALIWWRSSLGARSTRNSRRLRCRTSV